MMKNMEEWNLVVFLPQDKDKLKQKAKYIIVKKTGLERLHSTDVQLHNVLLYIILWAN